jgi:hypothetical protein
MGSPTQDVPGYYVWQVSGKPVEVHLQLDVLDRLGSEIMRGFGALPKRGAEAGGLLLGTITPGSPSIVRIDDFEPVPCQYRRGPSYVFTEDDSAAFERAFERTKPDPSRSIYAVGYFRGHTRDGLSLAPEDVELLDHLFPGPAQVALLVKPFGTKVSVAGFFMREDGVFPETTPLEFPFRRRELTGEEPPPRRSLLGRRPRLRDSGAPAPLGETVYPGPVPAASKPGSSWVWIPLSFIFLLLGAALGYQAAVNMGSRATGVSPQDYSLSLSVVKTGGNLTVRWDGQSAAVHAAQRGLLEIDDNGSTKSVQLDAAQLQNGSLIYRNSTQTVHFRLTVYPKARLSIVETLDWKE